MLSYNNHATSLEDPRQFPGGHALLNERCTSPELSSDEREDGKRVLHIPSVGFCSARVITILSG